jgi:hypothetical protein
MADAPRRRSARTEFRPRFTLLMLYFFALFFAFCFALVSPALYEIATAPLPGPEQERLAREATRDALRGRLWIAVVGATLVLGLGIRSRVLPGLRPPR